MHLDTKITNDIKIITKWKYGRRKYILGIVRSRGRPHDDFRAENNR